MPESKKDKSRKTNVDNFKTNKKRMNKEINETIAQMQQEQTQEQTQNTLPPIREIPTWGSKDSLDLNGLEFEYAYNAVTELAAKVNTVFGALQSVMQNNLASGKIKLNFEKLENGEYVKMTPEEEAPHQVNFAEMVEKYKASLSEIEQKKADAAKQEPIIQTVDTGFVDAAGQPISSN